MNFMGMGIPEMGVILLVAFLVLGPSRSIDMARNAGKILGDLRRQFNDVTSAVSIEALEARTNDQNREAMDQRTSGQDKREEPPPEPPPGVPMRPEIPPEDAGESEDTDTGFPNSGLANSGPTEAEPEDKG